jgi:hypothetical protein
LSDHHPDQPGAIVNIKREPAVLLIGIFPPIVAAIAAFAFAANPDTQGLVNVAAVAVAGAVTAFMVRSDNLLPAVTGALQAVIHAIAAFGFGWDASQQTALLVALSAVAAFVVRDRVTAPVPAPTVNA